MVKTRLSLDIGQTFNRLFRFKDDEGKPFDLTGYRARFQVREKKEKTSPLILDFDTEEEVSALTISDDPTDGDIILNIGWEDTAEFSPVRAFWELELISNDDQRRVVAGGPFIMELGVIQGEEDA